MKIVQLPNILDEIIRDKDNYSVDEYNICLDNTMLILELVKQIFIRFPSDRMYL